MKILFINDPPYGTERSFNVPRFAWTLPGAGAAALHQAGPGGVLRVCYSW